MRESTTVRVSNSTRDALRDLAAHDGLSMDEEIQRLARAERQRRIGASLANHKPDDDEQNWLDLGADSVSADARG
jgi:hypothetical protein